jgi:hypothetical protein
MRRYVLEGHSCRGLVDTCYIIGTRKIAEEYARLLTQSSDYDGDATYYTVVGNQKLWKDKNDK